MYKHLFFDLDHTLWDFERNSEEVLAELFWEHRLMRLGIRLFDFLSMYYEVTYALWHAYDEGHISPEDLRNSRFPTILKNWGPILRRFPARPWPKPTGSEPRAVLI
ncbi:MAG: hypothetical protein HC913_18350 [Microscillaceae bacterium]|nr:hypothetical protein [Microscillaceae bacterium]